MSLFQPNEKYYSLEAQLEGKKNQKMERNTLYILHLQDQGGEDSDSEFSIHPS